MLTAVVAVFMMAFVPVIVKVIQANEATIGMVRLLIAAAGVSLWLVMRKHSLRMSRREWLCLILLGLVFAVHWFTYFKSIKLSTPSIAAIGVATYGIHLTFLSRIFLKQASNWFDWVAVMVAFYGVYLVVPEFEWESDQVQGLLVGVVSGFLYACLPIIHQKSAHIPNSIRAWGQFAFALAAFCLLLPWSQWQLNTTDWSGLVFMGIVSTLAAHSLWVKATTELPGITTSMIYYLYVPITMVYSFVWTSESISMQMLLGATLIIGANVAGLGLRWLQSRRKSTTVKVS
nr:DMT family transporter [Pleionea sp. CnH1-48]